MIDSTNATRSTADALSAQCARTVAPSDNADIGARSFLKSPWSLHVVALCFFGLAWLADEPIARAMDQWYNGSPPLNGELHQLIISLAQYGQPIGTFTVLALMWIFDSRRRLRLLVLLAALVAAGIGSSLIKAAAGRERPRDSFGQSIFHGPGFDLGVTKRASFPSGHAATAYALSYSLSSFYPQTRWLVWPLAHGVAINRVATVRHFPSDVVAGAWFGYFIAAWILNARWSWVSARRLANRLHSLWSPLPAANDLRPLAKNLMTSPWPLVLTCLAIYWTGNGSYGLWDRDEPRFATATREMMQRGDWIVPTFNGELRPDKPILIYWLQSAAYRVFGDTPFAARFWSGVGGAAACLVTFFLGRAMFDHRVGLVAGWMLALSPMVVIESKLGTVDAVLLAFVTTSFYALWRIHEGQALVRHQLLFWVATSLAILTKGPVLVGVAAASIAAFIALTRDIRWLGRLGWLWGVPLAVLIVAPWCLLVQYKTQGEFLSRSIGHHVIARTLEPLENHSGFPGYYLVAILGLMAPWSFLLPWVIWVHGKRWLNDRRLAFLLTWAMSTVLIFEFVRTKLVHYVLPAYPALALLIASALVGRFGSEGLGIDRLSYRRLAHALVGLGVALIIACSAAGMAWLPWEVGSPVILAGTVGGLGLIFAGRFLFEGQVRFAFMTQCAVGAVTMLLVGANVLPAVHRQQTIVAVGEKLREERDRGAAVGLWHYRDPSLIYNLGHPVPLFDITRSEPPFVEASALARQTGGFLCPMTDDMLARMAHDPSLATRVEETINAPQLPGIASKPVHIVCVQSSEQWSLHSTNSPR